MSEERIKMESNNEIMANTMSKSGFTFNSAINELVDNATNTAKNIRVSLFVENNRQRPIKRLAVSDNGCGISLSILPKAMAMGVTMGNTIHEHGVGMKLAIAYFGHSSIRKGLHQIKSYDGKNAYAITGYEGNELIKKSMRVPPITGTMIEINVLHNITAANRITPLKDNLGIRYANFINDGGEITICEYDIKTNSITTDAKGNDIIHTVIPIIPTYFHPVTLTNVHLLKTEIVTENIVAELTMGISPDDEEGVWKKTSYGGGIDIVQDGRVICHRVFSPFSEWRPKNHTSLNGLVGQLVIKEGHLDTTPKKDALQETEEYIEIKKKIADIIAAKKISSYFNTNEEEDDEVIISESIIRNGLAKYLKDQTLPNGHIIWTDVKMEESTDTNLSMDVTASNDNIMYVFEVKKNNFNAQDMNQLIGYMVTVGANQGVVFARNILDNAKKQFNEHWKNHFPDMNIQYWDENTANYKTVLSTYVGDEE
jgi:hypothetical protein